MLISTNTRKHTGQGWTHLIGGQVDDHIGNLLSLCRTANQLVPHDIDIFLEKKQQL